MEYRVSLELENYICPEVQLLAIRQSVRNPGFSLAGLPPGLLPKPNGILQGRGQTAEEIARAALFLCSDQSSAMTGQSMYVDGGMAFSWELCAANRALCFRTAFETRAAYS